MKPTVQSILSYLGILWLVAFFAEKEERDDLSKYHLKQGLGLMVVALTYNVVVGIILMIVPSLSMLLGLTSIVFLILMVLGIITAANKVKRPLPLIGKLFENKFNFIDR